LDFEEHFAKTHILSHNFTATEYFFYEIRRGFSRLLYWLQKRSNTQKPLKFSSESHVFLLIAGLFTSITLLIFVFYFAVSKTYITIHPEYKIKTMTRNIVFAPKSEQSVLQQKILVDMRKIETISTIELKFNVTTLDESSARKSFGTIEILNELNQEQILKPNTRFVSDQGIVFRSVDWVRVPKTKVLSGVTNI
jgi:hypothetical protein